MICQWVSLAGHIDLVGCLMIILLAADFFLPMRMLGSFFHIAMNGMAASDKIFRLLDLRSPAQKTASVPEDCSIRCQNLHFSYEADREILHGVDMVFPKGSFTAIVGESGCGKSTIAAILMGRNKGYTGDITVGGTALSEISEESLMENFTYISHQSYLFKSTVRENLLMARPNAGEDTLWQVLEQVNLADFLRSEKGLDTILNEKASNLSGGQCQRLALARALLHNSPVYIFDEATFIILNQNILQGATFNILSLSRHSYKSLYFPIMIIGSTFRGERVISSKYFPNISLSKSLHFPRTSFLFSSSLSSHVLSSTKDTNEII